MRVADIDPTLVRGVGGVIGLAAGLAATRLADALPRRHGITHLASGPQRSRRNAVLVVLAIACWTGIAHVLTGARDLELAHAAVLLATNGIAVTCVLAGAAIDVEHMILPNVLTIGPALLCLATSPIRSVGLASAALGTALGLALTTLPHFLYARLRGRSGMGLGDAKLAALAGAWHGALAVPFVLFLAAVQSALAAGVLRLSGKQLAVPPSVVAELDALRARARSGDREAAEELASDPMAEGGGMRLPFVPFLALACLEVLFLRRWLVERVVVWLQQ